MSIYRRPSSAPVARPFRPTLLALAVVLALAAAACGSDSDDSDSGSAGSDSETSDTAAASTELASLETAVADYSAVPTEIVQTEPLTAKPPKKEVAFIVCADPSCVPLAGFLEDATTALGWDLITINATATDPGAAIQQAIDAGVDYIAQTGSDMAQFQPQMDEAESQGIPVFSCYATDVPEGPGNNLYADCYDSSAAADYAEALAAWMIVDSNAEANVVAVTLPAFPILGAQVDAAEAALSESCELCEFGVLDQTITDLTSGGTPNAIVSYLQANPDVNYVYLTYNGLGTGVVQAIEAAGLSDRVKVVGTQAKQPQLQEIIDGTSAMWSALPQEYSMWTLADQMARLSVDEWSAADERTSAIPPFYLITTAAAAEEIIDFENGWPGPDGFQDAFQELWGV
jgi:ribose transport system substrate-binding protein